MDWSEAIKTEVDKLKPIQVTSAVMQRVVSLMDLTSLNPTETANEMAVFFEKAKTPLGSVAAVCVWPDYVRMAANQFLDSSVKVATVANFPEGTLGLEEVLAAIGRSLDDGAQEIDVVFPYQRYLAGERQYAQSFIQACKAACGEVTLKVILETGVLDDPALIADAAYDVFEAGADFVKTSTGKLAEGTTLEAAATLLLVIKHMNTQQKRPLGLKVSGGIRTVEQAAQYVQLADEIMGRDWVQASTFRIGASKLIDEILNGAGGSV